MSTRPEDDDPANDRTRKLIDFGLDLAGATTTGALSLFIGPGAAPAGLVITRALKRVGTEIYERTLAPRQQVRTGAAFAYAADDIRRRLEAGDIPRSDWFSGANGPSVDAEEVLEGTLLNASNAYEERKVKYLAKLFGSLAFSICSTAHCHYLTGLASSLTYRQLVCVAVLSEPPPSGFKLFEATGEERVILDQGLRAELDELGQRGVIGFKQQNGSVARPSATLGGGHMSGMEIEKVVPTETGRLLHKSMGLSEIPASEQEAVRYAMRGKMYLPDEDSP